MFPTKSLFADRSKTFKLFRCVLLNGINAVTDTVSVISVHVTCAEHSMIDV